MEQVTSSSTSQSGSNPNSPSRKDGLKEAALLREAAKLLATVESDRTTLEIKLRDCSNQAAKIIHELEKELETSNEKYESLRKSNEATVVKYETTLSELYSKLQLLDESNQSMERIINTMNREKEIISELNHSLQDENKALKMVIATKAEEMLSLGRQYHNDLSETDDEVKDAKLQNHNLLSNYNQLHQLLDYYKDALKQSDTRVSGLESMISTIELEKEISEEQLIDSNTMLLKHQNVEQQNKILSNDFVLLEERYHNTQSDLILSQEKLIQLQKELNAITTTASMMTNATVYAEKDAKESEVDRNNLSIRLLELEVLYKNVLEEKDSLLQTIHSLQRNSRSEDNIAETDTRQNNITYNRIDQDEHNRIESNLESQILMLSERLNFLEDENSNLISKEVEDLNLWYNRIHELEYNVSDLSKELQNKGKRIEILESRLQEISMEMDRLKNISMMQSEEISMLSYERKCLFDTNRSADDNWKDDLHVKIAFYETKTLEYENIKASYEKELAEYKNLIELREDRIASYENDKAMKEEKIISYEKELAEYKNLIELHEDRIASYENDKAMKEEKIISYEKELAEYKNLIELHEDRIASYENDKAMKEEKIISYEKELAEYKNLIELHEDRIASYENDKAMKEEKIISYEKELAEYKNLIELHEDRIASHENDKAMKEEKIISYEKELAEYKNLIELHEDRIASHESKMTEYESTIASLEKTIQAYKVRIDILENSTDSYDDKIASYSRMIASYQDTVAFHQSTIASYDTKISGHQRTIAANEGKINNYEGTIRTYKEKISDYDTQLAALSSDRESYKTNLFKTESHRDSLLLDIEAYKQKLSILEQNSLDDNNAMKLEYANRINTLESELMDCRSTMKVQSDVENELKNRVIYLETLQMTAMNAITEKDKLERDTMELLEQYEEAKKHIDNLNDDISKLQLNVNEKEVDIHYKQSQNDMLTSQIQSYEREKESYLIQIQLLESQLQSNTILSSEKSVSTTLPLPSMSILELEKELKDRNNTVEVIKSSYEELMQKYSSLSQSYQALQQSVQNKSDNNQNDQISPMKSPMVSPRSKTPMISSNEHHEALDKAEETIASLVFQVKSLESELILIKEQEKYRLFNEVEARKSIERELGDKREDADYLLQELILAKVYCATQNDELAKVKNALAICRRQHLDSTHAKSNIIHDHPVHSGHATIERNAHDSRIRPNSIHPIPSYPQSHSDREVVNGRRHSNTVTEPISLIHPMSESPSKPSTASSNVSSSATTSPSAPPRTRTRAATSSNADNNSSSSKNFPLLKAGDFLSSAAGNLFKLFDDDTPVPSSNTSSKATNSNTNTPLRNSQREGLKSKNDSVASTSKK